ncbi:MAG: glycosyltransferase family 39 protein [Actinomycetota bacterium]|nr:glycosyltransferase family 39 protein [Actinomycetota bacterium]
MASTLERDPGLLEDFRRLWGQAPSARLRLALGLAGVVVVVGVVLRFWSPTALWLDETISVNIAKLPLTAIPKALSHDGSPPLYYYVLHFWMLAFGQSDFAVRALSGVVSVASLPLFWSAGRRFGGQRTAWVTFGLGLTSPFAIDYATTTRMYSFMIFWTLLGVGILWRVLEEPTRRRRIALGALTAAILYTHYYGIYLVATVGLWFFWRIVRESRKGPSPLDPPGIRPAFGAMVIGVVCWLPWAPVFIYQTLHTGSPWTGSAGPADLLGIFGDFAGNGAWGALLSFGFFALVILGIFGRPTEAISDDGRPTSGVLLVGRPHADVLPLVVILAGTLVVAVALDAIAQAAFVARYASVVLPLFLILVALGVSVIRDRRVFAVLAGVACLAGLLSASGAKGDQRTEATRVAAVLNVQAQPGDLVVYCPDQLGPAVSRLLTVPQVTQLTFPRAIGPQRVDWVDYKSTVSKTDVGTFAQQTLGRLGANHTLWLVWRDGYPGLGGSCGYLHSWFNMLRHAGETVVHATPGQYYEYENLVRYSS